MNKHHLKNKNQTQEQKQAQSLEEKALRLLPIINRANRAGDDLFNEGKYQEALDKYKPNLSLMGSAAFKPLGAKSQEFSQAETEAYYNVGFCYAKLERWTEAEEHLKLVLKRQKRYPKAEIVLAQTLNKLNQHEQALSYYKGLVDDPTQGSQARQELSATHYLIGFKCLQANNFDDALPHFNEVAKHSESPLIKIMSLFHLGTIFGDPRFPRRDPKQAVHYFEQATVLYKQHEILFTDQQHKSVVAVGIHLYAMLLDQPEEGVSANPERVLELLNLAGSLGSAGAWHDLGYKHQHGEDVEPSIDKAIGFYTDARNLKHAPSQCELGLIFLNNPEKRDVKEGLNCLNEADSQNYGLAAHYLGNYYLEFDLVQQGSMAIISPAVTAPTKTDEKALGPDETKKSNALAFQKYTQAATLDVSGSHFNVARMLHTGTGVGRNLEQAEHHYLQAAKTEPLAFRGLFSVLKKRLSKFLLENVIPVHLLESPIAGLTPELDEFRKLLTDAIDYFKQAKSEDYRAEEFSSELSVNQIVKNISSKKLPLGFIKPKIDPSAVLGKFERAIIKQLEILSSQSVLVAEIVNTVKSVGDFTEASLDKRQFHQSQFLNLRLLLKKASGLLAANQLDDHAVVKVIVGVSKFHLTATVFEHRECMVLFYKKALTLKLELKDQVAIFYAATRLDPSLSIFKTELPQLMTKILKIKWDVLPCDQTHKRIFGNLAYALAHMGEGGFSYWKSDMASFNGFITSLLKQCMQVMADVKKQTAQGTDEKQTAVSMTEEEGMYLQQVFLALSYFKKADPTFPVKDSLIRDLEVLVNQKPMETRTSKSQASVFAYVRKYFPDAEEEKVVFTLPVDGEFQVSESQSFGLQYHGPVHWLHGEEGIEPILTLKSRVQATIIKAVQPNLVIVPYFKVPFGASDAQIHEFLVPELAKFGVTLTQPLETVVSKKDKKKDKIYEQKPHGSLWSSAPKPTQAVPTPTVVDVIPTITVAIQPTREPGQRTV